MIVGRPITTDDWITLRNLRSSVAWMKEQNTGNFDKSLEYEGRAYKALLKDYLAA